MLDPAVTARDEAGNDLERLADEGLAYHELLHGQLLIDAMDNDANWQKKVCNCQFDLAPSDGEHTAIDPAVDGYLENRASGIANVTVVKPPKQNADQDGSFDIELGAANKERFTFTAHFPSDGGNVDRDSITVEIVEGKFHVKGKLKDKTKPGLFFLRIDPVTQWIIAGIEEGVVVLPAPLSCPPVPVASCDAPERSILRILDNNDDAGDRIRFDFVNGTPAEGSVFGDPTATESYTLCIYDHGALVAQLGLPAGSAGWKPIGSAGVGFKYTDPTAALDGTAQVLLRAGKTGTPKPTKVVWIGKGAALPDPTVPVPTPVDITVQVVGSDGTCFGDSYTDANVKQNAANAANTVRTFKAKKP
jgi:hypothetical protein